MAKKPKSAEIHQGPGFRVRKTVTRPAVDIIKQYGQFETPDIYDLLILMYTMSIKIPRHNQSFEPTLKISAVQFNR